MLNGLPFRHPDLLLTLSPFPQWWLPIDKSYNPQNTEIIIIIWHFTPLSIIRKYFSVRNICAVEIVHFRKMEFFLQTISWEFFLNHHHHQYIFICFMFIQLVLCCKIISIDIKWSFVALKKKVMKQANWILIKRITFWCFFSKNS